MRLKYPSPAARVPPERREAINRKLVTLVRSGALGTLTPDDVQAAFTGLGGLHGLNRHDYRSYHEYASGKRERELGQFFTPNSVTSAVVQLLDPQPHHTILDLAVGHGAFINALAGHHPDLEARTFGCDVDDDALTIARYLYPRASLARESLATYHPGTLADMVTGNPPFSLPLSHRGETWQSEHLYLHRAAELLKPGGLIALVVPRTFLSDEFHHRTHLQRVSEQFRYLTRIPLPQGTFDVSIDTCILVLQRASEHLPHRAIDPDHLDQRPLERIRSETIAPAQAEAERVRHLLARELKERDRDTRERTHRIEQHLYHLHAHPRLHAHAQRITHRYERALHEQRPEGMSAKAWEAQRVTLEQVEREARTALREQHTRERDEIRLVKTNAGVRLKAYSARLEQGLDPERSRWSWAELAREREDTWPSELRDHPLRAVARAKARRYQQHASTLAEVTPDEALVASLMGETRRKASSSGPQAFHFNRLQAEDTARLLQRRYAFLALGMGSGKTAMGHAWLTRSARARDVRVILGPALAIQQTWIPFLRANGAPFTLVRSRADALAITPGSTVLLSMSMLHTLKRPLQRAFRRLARRLVLLVDESDELANFDTRQTQAALAIFRHANAKLLMTGTITRNASREAYAQLALLYGATELFTSDAPRIYLPHPKTGDLEAHPNPQRGQPFTHRAGLSNFTASFNPRKTTVFGIEKQIQDVYNLDELAALMRRSMIRRSFAEVVGPDKYSIEQHTLPLEPAERALHETLMRDFDTIISDYFGSTGDRRKDAGLRAVRQLRLLIESCLHAHLFREYAGASPSSKFRATRALIERLPTNERILLGVPRRVVFGTDYLEHWRAFLAPSGRTLYTLHGGMSFSTRNAIVQAFLTTPGAVLIASTAALRSSVNLRGTQHVILPALAWNLSRLQQFAFRAIRLDNNHPTRVHYITHAASVETNLWRLLTSKEIGNIAVAEGRAPTQHEIANALELDPELLRAVLTRVHDEDGNASLAWGSNLMPSPATHPAAPT